MKARVFLAAAVTLGSTGVSVLIGAPAANAQQACGWSVNTGTQVPSNATMDGPYNSYNLYSGNSSSCAKTGATVLEGSAVRVYCHENNNAGNSWLYVSPYGSIRGWVSRANVSSYWPSVPNCS
ncbi:SH3 domain-containing protein [Nocardia sp. NPDC052001]|uniref:SH3 domain-containing protein n=1 Tax=Nocardia sp. NPDC052001 TaxID=3154853 RepID=UPI0034367556